jgi:hypothetical protein
MVVGNMQHLLNRLEYLHGFRLGRGYCSLLLKLVMITKEGSEDLERGDTVCGGKGIFSMKVYTRSPVTKQFLYIYLNSKIWSLKYECDSLISLVLESRLPARVRSNGAAVSQIIIEVGRVMTQVVTGSQLWLEILLLLSPNVKHSLVVYASHTYLAIHGPYHTHNVGGIPAGSLDFALNLHSRPYWHWPEVAHSDRS